MNNKPKALLPPSTRGWPLVGTLPKILKNKLYDFLLAARDKYGEIYTLNLGVTKIIVLNHPRHAQHVLRTHAGNYHKGGPMWETLRTLIGNGLATSEGDFWLRQRRMMQPQFHQKRLAALTNLMVEAIDEELADWDTAVASSQPFNIAAACPRITMKVNVKALFGTGMPSQEANKVIKALTFLLDYMLWGIFTHSLPKWLPVPGRRRYQQALQTINEVVFGVIERRRQVEGESNDLMTMLLQMADEETGERMTDTQLRDEAVTMFLAGYETTSSALAWIFHFLTQHPETVGKLQAEIDRVLGGRKPTLSDLPQLTYAKMVIQETLRLHPPAWWLLRMASEDDEIDGFQIPAGTMVAPMPYTVHHHPDFWQNPHQFDPERFTPERSAGRHPLAWIPFGAGQRQCIGKAFAMMMSQLVLARIMQCFQVEPATGRVAQKKAAMTLKSKDGIFIKLNQRENLAGAFNPTPATVLSKGIKPCQYKKLVKEQSFFLCWSQFFSSVLL